MSTASTSDQKTPAPGPINVFDYEALARERMAPATWDFYQGGSEDEVTLRGNRSAFERLCLRPRVLTDVTTIDPHTSVQGSAIDVPILIAPTAFHRLVDAEGECATARATTQAGTIMIAGTFASRSLEEIAASARGPLWFQLYVYRNRTITQTLIQRAEAAGYRAIVLTVDVPRLGRRERDIRNAFTLPSDVYAANFTADLIEPGYIPEPAVITWDTVAWLRSITALPIILKGILTAEDAMLAVEHGAAGVIVSNHGGRQLDGAIASLDALPEIASVVPPTCEVYMDGGIRRGTDVLKALALGARAVLIGRPGLWGLAVNGSHGVWHVLELLRTELMHAMALVGCSDIKSISPSFVISSIPTTRIST